MQSVEPQSLEAIRDEFHVVLLENLNPTPGEWRRAGVGTGIVHLLLLLILVSIPKDSTEAPEKPRPRTVTKLFDPPTKLTQRAPNKAPVTHDISVAPTVEAPRHVAVAKVVPKTFQPPPVQRAAKQNPAPAAPQEPPRIKAAAPQAVQLTLPPAVTPPPPVSNEPPKIALENVPPARTFGHGTGLLKVPSGGVEEAVKELSRSNVTPSRSVGDDTNDDLSGAPAARPKTSLEMESDPQGVDMKPYLLQVLQTVRKNWLSIYPEGARLGLRGRVVVQFAVLPNGEISKIVFITESQARALNEASVAALSMSNHLPQLPAGFKGDRVVLQFTFLYNAPTSLRR